VTDPDDYDFEDDPYAGLTEDPFADRDYDDELAPRRQQRHTRSGHEQAEESSLPAPVDWAELFATDSSDHLWLVDDLWPDGRQIHIFAKAKTGKSLVMLWMAANLANGHDPFTGQPVEPKRVAYLDFEMTADDLRERLEDMGFGPDVLANLVYYLLPLMPPLNTEAGGRRLVQLLERDRAEVVVIDTFSRVVDGEENSADTYQDFYTYTGLLLKRRHIALARLDHEGHQGGRSRGSSAKGDDVDAVWQLTRTDTGYVFKNKGGRVAWLASEITITARSEPLAYTRGLKQYTARALEIVRQLDALGVPPDAGRGTARSAALAADPGFKAASDDLNQAVSYRKNRATNGAR